MYLTHIEGSIFILNINHTIKITLYSLYKKQIIINKLQRDPGTTTEVIWNPSLQTFFSKSKLLVQVSIINI